MGSSMSAYRSLYYETQDHLEEVESDTESECCESECCEQKCEQNCEPECCEQNCEPECCEQNCCEQNCEPECCEQVEFLKNQIKNLELRIILLEKKTKFKSVLI